MPKKTSSPRASIAIVGGCGHVGLPFGMVLADKGFDVHLYDIGVEWVKLVNSGTMPFMEDGAEPMLKAMLKTGRLKAGSDITVLEKVDIVIITIGTPVDEYLDPSVQSFDAALEKLMGHAKKGQLWILRSTVFPGVTERLSAQLQKLKKDIDLAYCPERIVQGKSLEELKELPQIIGASSKRAEERAAELFRTISPSIVTLKPVEAELSKLYANAWRYINFAISNQFWVIAQEFGADFTKIHAALLKDYPRMKAFARAGFAAGPCLHKDTMQLGAFNHGSFVLGQAAMMINEGLPYIFIQRLKKRYPLKDMTVGLLGMAFKPNIDDPRSSLSYKLRKILLLEAKEVLCSDPFVRDSSLVPEAQLLKRADIIIIGTPHERYKSMKFRVPVEDITSCITN